MMKNINFELLERVFNNIHIEVLEHGHLFADDNWKYYNITSPFNRLYFVLDGCARIKNSKASIDLTSGNAYLIPIYSTNDYICEGFVEKFYVHFRAEIFAGIDIFETLGSCHFLSFDRTQIDDLIERLGNKELSSLFILKSILFNIVYRFLEQTSINLNKPFDSALKYHRVFEFINKNISLKLTPGKISDNLGLQQDILVKGFRSDMGYSLKTCIYNVILRNAKEKLLLTDLRIKEIAYALEFCDEFHFSRFIKKHTGLSPTEYRKKNSVRL